MALTTILMAAGTALQTFGQLQAAEEAENVGRYNAAVARNQAIGARKQSEFEAKKQRDMTRKLLATQRARYAGSGVTSSGSPLTVMADTAMEGELDARAIEYGGELEAMGYESQAAMAKWEGKRQANALMTKAFTSLLSGASGMYGNMGSGTPLISGQSGADITRYKQLMAVK